MFFMTAKLDIIDYIETRYHDIVTRDACILLKKFRLLASYGSNSIQITELDIS